MSSKLYEHVHNGTLTAAFLRENQSAIMQGVDGNRVRNPLVLVAMECMPSRLSSERLSSLRQMARMIMHVLPRLLQAKDVVKCTVVHEVARWCRDEAMLEMVMGHDLADVNGKDSVEYMPLHYAAAVGNIAAMRRLVSLGASVDALTNAMGERYPPLFFALQFPTAVSVLLGAKADATWVGKHGMTLMHCVSEETPEPSPDDGDAIEVFRMLLMAGADLLAKDSSGKTPADRAAFMNRAAIAGWLRRAETRVVSRGMWWRPPNHWLCRREVRAVVHESLLAAQRIRVIPIELWFYVFEFLPVHRGSD